VAWGKSEQRSYGGTRAAGLFHKARGEESTMSSQFHNIGLWPSMVVRSLSRGAVACLHGEGALQRGRLGAVQYLEIAGEDQSAMVIKCSSPNSFGSSAV